MKVALDNFCADQHLRVAAASYEPENHGAKKLDASLGFQETGEMAGDELPAVLNLR